jgi:NAD(P)-dependent dehydrogenase (short-subunit alcohol dehydrogenase family)
LQIEDVPDDLWRQFFAVNVGGASSMTRSAVPIQPHAPAAWPQLAKPFSKMRQRA